MIMKIIAENQAVDLLKPLRIGEIIQGKVCGLGRSTIYIDLGPLGAGIVYGKEFYDAKNALKKLEMGDTLLLKVVDLDNEDGYIELSLSQAGKELGWGKLQDQKKEDETITIKIIGANKGGLLADFEGFQGFLPVSQLSPKHYPRVEGADKTKILTKLQELVGQEIEVKILTLDPKKEIVIFSEKATETKKNKEALAKYKAGDTVETEITGIVSFGVFMKILPDDLEGLCHISELDWQLIDDPAEVVELGEKVKAKIIEITPDGRISLSLKALKKDPWENITDVYKKNQEIKGKVTKFNPFGAFIEISPRIQGLVHISEFGNQAKMEEVLKINKTYGFQIVQIEPKEHRMTLKLIENK